WILGIGKSSKPEWNYAGTGYKAAFIYMYQKQRCIFFEEFDDDECKLTIYNKQMEISHAIKKYVRLGFDIETGQDIENAIQGIRGAFVLYLQPNRDR
ncbi:25648_t:CDS:2, partial [Dentiscutata erythropus]